MSKNSEAVKKWRSTTKARIVQSMGGKCQICSYSKCNAALELHHLDPTQKEIGFGDLIASPKAWAKAVAELRKCILLCSNCHKEVHYNAVEIPQEFKKFDESFLIYKEPTPIQFCICGKPKIAGNVYCSKVCSGLNTSRQTKADWSSIDLVELVETKGISFTRLADQFDCSDKTISYWYRKQKMAGMGGLEPPTACALD